MLVVDDALFVVLYSNVIIQVGRRGGHRYDFVQAMRPTHSPWESVACSSAARRRRARYRRSRLTTMTKSRLFCVYIILLFSLFRSAIEREVRFTGSSRDGEENADVLRPGPNWRDPNWTLCFKKLLTIDLHCGGVKTARIFCGCSTRAGPGEEPTIAVVNFIIFDFLNVGSEEFGFSIICLQSQFSSA